MLRRRSPRGSPPASRACAASGALFRFDLSSSVAKRRLPAKPGAARRAPMAAPDCHDRKRLRRLFAVGLMTAAAILAHLGDLDLEAVEVRGRGRRRLGIAGE